MLFPGLSEKSSKRQIQPSVIPNPSRKKSFARKELGMDYVDINLGPAKKFGEELMPWVVNVVQEAVPGMPLLLDSSNIAAIEAGLKVCQTG